MPTFYDLQKFAATGIASPDMTAYDKARALAAFGGKMQTLTGVPPLEFPSKTGKPLISWSMLGNTQQTGTPSPQSIIMPQFVGVRTGNLFDVSTVEKGRIDNGEVGYVSQTSSLTIEGGTVSFTTTATYRGVCSGFFEIPETGTLWFNFTTNKALGVKFVFYDGSKTWLNSDYIHTVTAPFPATTTIPNGAKYVRISFTGQITGGSDYTMSNIMLNLGTTALPYEPYGWAEKITCGGQTTPVYLGQTQTVRRIKKLVFDGTENWNEGASNYYIFIDVSGRGVGIPNSTALSTHTGNGVVVNNNGTALFFKKSVFVHSSLADFKTYLQQQHAAGTPVVVWYVLETPKTGIINEPLCKIGDYADELHSEDAGVSIPTVKGENTLTVEGDLPPSSMTITYNG